MSFVYMWLNHVASCCDPHCGYQHWNVKKPKQTRHVFINQTVKASTWNLSGVLQLKRHRSHFCAVIFGSTLGTYWSNHPSTTAARNRLWTFTVGPFWRGVKHAVPGASAVMCVLCVCACVIQKSGGFVVYHSPHIMSGTVGTVAGNRAKVQPGDSLWSQTACC